MYRATIAILSSNPKYLEQAIKGAINQTYHDYKIVVRDNKQSDEIKQITEKLMDDCDTLSYVRNSTDLKEHGNWIESVTNCDTEFLLTAHDDDILHPHIVEEQIRLFDSMENIIQVTADMTHIDLNGQIISDPECDGSIEILKKNEYASYLCEKLSNNVASPTVMVRVNSIKNIVCTEEFRKLCLDDINRNLLINNIGDICIIHKSLCYYRRHLNQTSSLPKPSYWDSPYLMLPLLEQICGFKKAMLFKCWLIHRQYECKIIQDVYIEVLEYLKSEGIKPSNVLEYSFLMRIFFLKKKFAGQVVEAAIWGAGGAGQKSFGMIQKFLTNFKVTCFIDREKEGTVLDLPIYSSVHFNNKSIKYIFVCIGENDCFDVFNTLGDMGYIIGSDFIGGYGVHSGIDFDIVF